MYSFEGQFRRKPVQSLGGASRKEERSSLLHRAQEERRKREDNRKRLLSAIKIQSFFRACKVRAQQKEIIRQVFDKHCNDVQKGHVKVDNPQMLVCLLRTLIFMYSNSKDVHRLTWLCQLLIKHQKLMGMYICSCEQIGLYQLTRILALCLRQLEAIAGTSTSIAVPMRMLEVYVGTQVYTAGLQANQAQALDIVHRLLMFLIDKGYYKCMRVLVEEKIPASLEKTIVPPTPIAGSILDLIKKPLQMVVHSSHVQFRNATLQSLCKELFCQSFPEQVKQFVLPALSNGSEPFPFVPLLHSLVPDSQNMVIKRHRNGVSNKDYRGTDWVLMVEATPFLLCTVLTFSERYLDQLSKPELQLYLLVLYKLVPQLRLETLHNLEEDEDDIAMDIEFTMNGSSLGEIQQDCVRLLDEPQHVKGMVSLLTREPDPAILTAVCTVCHTLMAHNKLVIHKTSLLYSLALNAVFLRNLWFTCVSVSTTLQTGAQVSLLAMLSRGMEMRQEDIDRIVPILSTFCSLFSHSLLSLHDSDFYRDNPQANSSMPFSPVELVPMTQALRDACLGIIELAHPDTKPTLREDYKKAFQSVGAVKNIMSAAELETQRDIWAYLFRVTAQLVKHLYARDVRRRFCPDGHWLSRQINIQADKPSQLYRTQNSVFVRRPFGALSALNTQKMLEEEGPPLSTTEVRNLTVLTELPFVVPFEERVKIFHKLVHQDRIDQQGEMRHFMGGPHISILVRRNYLYEDAFEKLSPENEPNLKLKMQVQLINFAGLDEAGIDGGGIFREFMSELIKTGFDPNRGFFKYTIDKLLYPNPQAHLITDNYTQHYYFLGRILGKALFESMLVELPFASFFLSKILSRYSGDVDIHHLASLDPEMYKNLLFLKHYDGDVSGLDLDFTVVNNELGEAQMEELKPGGRDIPVTNHNRIEYIHLMADYRLNKQIRLQCSAFRQGLADLVNLEWLRMFDHHEMQTLISGALVPIDIEDLKRHTNYSGDYNDEHAVIKSFWEVVASFTDKQKRQLLKFVTSCSRPPLLGFKELYPAFCIQHAGNEAERLPTASTCMNLLKLPEFKDEETLRAKLLYAIESGSGFELS